MGIELKECGGTLNFQVVVKIEGEEGHRSVVLPSKGRMPFHSHIIYDRPPLRLPEGITVEFPDGRRTVLENDLVLAQEDFEEQFHALMASQVEQDGTSVEGEGVEA